MMQVDLTMTKLMQPDSSVRPPSEAEMFALTAAMLVANDLAYSDLEDGGLQLTDEAVRSVAECIEYRLPAFTRDVGFGEVLRQRLSQLVGLRISVLGQAQRTQKPGT